MLSRAQIIWATALVLCMDRPVPHDMPIVYPPEEEEEEENEPNS